MKAFLLTFFLLCVSIASLDAQVVYTVTVPEGTTECFISGEVTGGGFQRMTKKSTNVFTISLPYANTSQPYHYYAGPDFHFIETMDDGSNVPSRNYTANDQVIKWALLWDGTNDFPPAVEAGSLIRHYFNSAIVDDRYIDVWLPDGYNTLTKYNVLYMHDGEMLFNPGATYNGQEWNVDSTMGSLNALGIIEPAIVVGIHSNGNKRHAEYFPQKVISAIPEPQKTELGWYLVGNTYADNYLKFIVNELKPYIDANYSTNPGQQNTFMAGSSMGGLISMYAFCEYPNVFSGAACLSTHWIGTYTDNTQIPAALDNYIQLHLPLAAGRKIYFDHGTLGLDAYYSPYQQNVNNTILSKGYTDPNFSSQVFPGAEHNENSWRVRFGIPATFILPRSTILAVSLFNFRVLPKEDKDLLSWQVSGRNGEGKFRIERSKDGVFFSSLGDMPETNEIAYSFLDNYPLAGINYYRVQLQENNGRIVNSEVITIRHHKPIEINVHPNPSKDYVIIEGLNSAENKMLIVTDSKGARQYLPFDHQNKRLNIVSLAKGIYFLSTGNRVIKFIKQ